MARKNLLKDLTFPTQHDFSFDEGESSETYGKFVAYPFESGFGTSIGNMLRRILLSSIQGYAVSGISFSYRTKDKAVKHVNSEFEPIPGVKEDVVEIIAQLKKMRVKISNPESQSIVVLAEVKGKGELTAAAFNKDGLEVMNKDLHILTSNEDADFDFEIQVDFGRGFISQEENDKYKEQVGVIAIDAIYSPVKRVKYFVENARVGQRTNFDKLTLEIFTDGSISPRDALGEASYLAQEYLKHFVNFDSSSVVSVEATGIENEALKEKLDMTVAELELSNRVMNVLVRAGINTVRELVMKKESELKAEKNFGANCLKEVKEKLAEIGLGFADSKDKPAPASDDNSSK